MVNIQELARVAVDVREPGALDLHHDAMAFFELVENVVECDLEPRRGIRLYRLCRPILWNDSGSGLFVYTGFCSA